MTAAYWLIGRRIVESEQKGEKRAAYGEELLKRLPVDLSQRFGRGFGVDNLQRFRTFYLVYPLERIYATLSRKLHSEDPKHIPGIYNYCDRRCERCPFTSRRLNCAQKCPIDGCVDPEVS
jgi:hypothetical protein